MLSSKQAVELYQILKFAGLVTRGSEAKAVINAGKVRINGKIAKRKRRKSLQVILLRPEMIK